MILYRVQHGETGAGPFGVITRNRTLLWEAGPTPREEIWNDLGDDYHFTMAGKRCAVHRPHLLSNWFPKPEALVAFGLVLTVWDVPDDKVQAWTFQAVFDESAATLIRTLPLPERWDDILDLLERIPEES